MNFFCESYNHQHTCISFNFIWEKYLKTVLLASMILLIPLFQSCRQAEEVRIPVIPVDDRDNVFTFTNKISGFYTGRARSENQSESSGWMIAGRQYLRDYRIWFNGNIVSRDSSRRASYYPHQLQREYSSGLIETVTLLDTINAIVWQFSSLNKAMELKFKPLFHDSTMQSPVLDSQQNQIFISPADTSLKSEPGTPSVLAFQFLRESEEQITVLGVSGDDLPAAKDELDRLVQSYKIKIRFRRDRLIGLLRQNDVITNIPEITEAVQWAQMSLDGLVSGGPYPGIWSGIPNSANHHGRDTFISLTGALLCSGNFATARQILLRFADFQLTDADDSWMGRIPNRMTGQEISYNTSDVTWWYIRCVYEYVLYSGDRQFVSDIFPVIRYAIEGALRYRIDKNFFLKHRPGETWMGTGRGNRAVEIQTLWYTALQAGSILAALTGEHTLAEHWLTIAEELKRNFLNGYWNDYNFRMSDHLTARDKSDKNLNINQIFTVTIPGLSGIEPLIGEEAEAYVTSQITNQLATRYGVGTAANRLEESYPVLSDAFESAGTPPVVTWLSGPLISALKVCHRENLMFDLYYNQATQILDWDAVGSLSQLLALKWPEPDVAGNFSQAISLAEFVRNYYQDFIGFRPNALTNVIEFTPFFTEEFIFLSARLPMAGTMITFTGEKNDEFTNIKIRTEVPHDTLRVVINYAGYERRYFTMTPSGSELEIIYENSKRRQYRKFNHLDWHFGQLPKSGFENE